MIKEIKLLPRIKAGAPGLPPRQLILECDGCHTVFERLYTTELFKKERHFCGTDCWYEYARCPMGSRGAEMVTMTCGFCAKPITRLASQIVGKTSLFCDRKCLSEHKKIHQHPNAIEALKRTTADPEFRAFMSEQAKARFERDGHPWTDRQHTEETKAKLRLSHALTGRSKGTKNGMYGRGHTEASRVKMSEAHSRNIVEGKGYIYGGTGHSHGQYTSSKGNDGQSMYYRSSWERAMMFYLDADESVTRYDFERLRIEYWDIDHHKRHYVPDFLVTYADGHRAMYEIKPKQFLNNEKTKLKAEAARAYCEANGVQTHEILTGELLRERGIIT
jgi:hypothetical protein